MLKQPFVSIDEPPTQIRAAIITLVDTTDVKHCRGAKPRLWAIDQVELYQNDVDTKSLFVEEGKRNLVLTCHQLTYSGATGGCQSEAHLIGRRGPGDFIGAQDYPIKLSADVTYNISCEYDRANTSHYQVTQISGH